ncbi:MAG: tRNA (guanosine(46)-N7)-methyltransferase TrmB [Propionibacteriaceae bacterium]|jgi:tRNA (guanine-N7-)-methyltransferase|nr:tRNA (guanosine(46)-N7)-methyltransferase TrmB [Propionibacteriaceae bacterium]
MAGLVAEMAEEHIRRDVVSYVRRSDRMNESQRTAWDSLRSVYVVDLPTGQRRTSIAEDAQVDWAGEFGREAPLFVEIGIGDGEAICALAAKFPQANVVGFEVYLPGVASCLSRLERKAVENVRLVVADGRQGLETVLSGITELWTLFPDPWQKKRHSKRRLVNVDFARLVAAKLLPGGRWRLATDWEDYALGMRDILDAQPGLANEYEGNEHDGWAPRWEDRPLTKFERRGIAAGRRCYDLSYLAVG